MVLTNFEFWAADGSSMPSTEFETSAHHHNNRHMNPFDPRVVPHVPTRNMTHLSSNGYYGFSYINAAHDSELNNNNNNNNTITNNNNISTHNFMDVNGMNITPTPVAQQQQPPPYANFIGSNNSIEKPPAFNVAAAGGNASRCKKRFFVVNSDDADSNGAAAYCTNASAKRCRFDDDFAAQYCNDFFSLPSTQIATQSCLMDTEEGVLQQPQQQQLHQQQVDEAMYENNNNNIYNYNNNNIEKHEQSILHLQLQQQQSQMPAQQQPPTQQQQDLQQQQPQYHQQQHYQGHLHRIANRDVSRCMLSHMI